MTAACLLPDLPDQNERDDANKCALRWVDLKIAQCDDDHHRKLAERGDDLIGLEYLIFVWPRQKQKERQTNVRYDVCHLQSDDADTQAR